MKTIIHVNQHKIKANTKNGTNEPLMNIDNPTRVSIFVESADTSIVLCHIWEEESHEKHKEMFNSILRYWQLVKNYEWYGNEI